MNQWRSWTDGEAWADLDPRKVDSKQFAAEFLHIFVTYQLPKLSKTVQSHPRHPGHPGLAGVNLQTLYRIIVMFYY